MGLVRNIRKIMHRNLTFNRSSTFTIIDSFKGKDVFTWIYQFQLPLFYSNPERGSIKIVAKITQLYKNTTEESRLKGPDFKDTDKLILFLQGGPGFESYTPKNKDGFVGYLLDKDYTVVNYDQRGTGLSTPLDYNSFMSLASSLSLKSEDHINLIKCFRADSIVKDCEEIRKILLKKNVDKKWSIQGQSYGGFCAFNYLSFYPDSLNEVILTGGIPGIGLTIEDVYKATFKRTKERNTHYYTKYPQDILRVKQIVTYLNENNIKLPSGGHLTVERFQQLGLKFGGSGGTDSLHNIILNLYNSLDQFGYFSKSTLYSIDNILLFDTNVLYALFQEAIYMDGNKGVASNWCADRIRYLPDNQRFFDLKYILSNSDEKSWLKDENSPFFFTGEMVFKSMFDDYAELRDFKRLAYELHNEENWSDLYNCDQLKKIFDCKKSFFQKKYVNGLQDMNEDEVKIVKIVAAVYFYDQYVDFDLSRHTFENVVGKLRPFITSEYFHNGIGVGTEHIMDKLFALLEEEVD